MRSLKKVLVFFLIVVSLIVTLTFADDSSNKTNYEEVFGEIEYQAFYSPYNTDKPILTGSNIQSNAYFLSLRFFGGKTDIPVTIEGYVYNATVRLKNLDLLLRIGPSFIKLYGGAGYSRLTVSIGGYSSSINFINYLWGVSIYLGPLATFGERMYLISLDPQYQNTSFFSVGIGIRY